MRVRVRLEQDILYRKLLPSRPSHHRFRDLDALLFRERDGQREGFSWTHGKISRNSPACTREIPHGPLASEWSRVVGDGALHREATEGANREGHGSLTGKVIVEADRSNHKAGELSTARIDWRSVPEPRGSARGLRRLWLPLTPCQRGYVHGSDNAPTLTDTEWRPLSLVEDMGKSVTSGGDGGA